MDRDLALSVVQSLTTIKNLIHEIAVYSDPTPETRSVNDSMSRELDIQEPPVINPEPDTRKQ